MAPAVDTIVTVPMTFSPRMQSTTEGFAVVGALKWRVWTGVVADLWEVDCTVGAQGDYVSPDPRLFVPLELDPGGSFSLKQTGRGDAQRHETPLSMSFVPAGMPVRGNAEGLTRLKHLDLHFSETALLQRFGRLLDRERLMKPRFGFFDRRMAGLAGAVAAECDNIEPLHDLYGDGLVNALLTLLFDVRRREGRRRPALSPHQLRLVTDFIEDRCLGPIRLAELSVLVGLSESYFSHAFKAATGVPPHRWHMQARIRRVQDMLATGNLFLSDVAALTGFSDQAHLTRVFKSVVGVAPSTWMRERTAVRS